MATWANHLLLQRGYGFVLDFKKIKKDVLCPKVLVAYTFYIFVQQGLSCFQEEQMLMGTIFQAHVVTCINRIYSPLRTLTWPQVSLG